MIEVDGHQIGRGADPVLYCSWSSQHDLIALASDDCIVSIFKSDHGWPDRLEKGADHAQSKQGTAENTKIKISYQHVQQKIESYANDESIRGMYNAYCGKNFHLQKKSASCGALENIHLFGYSSLQRKL